MRRVATLERTKEQARLIAMIERSFAKGGHFSLTMKIWDVFTRFLPLPPPGLELLSVCCEQRCHQLLFTEDSLIGHERRPMAEPEVEAAWRAEFKRSGARELRDAVNNGDGITDESKRLASFRWLGDEAEARRLQQEHTYHYVRWAFLVALAALIASLIPVGLALLR
jgi:hypothetical protein